MTSSIGGNLETSILMDASGVRMATQNATRDLEVLSGAVKRTSAEFQASAGGTNVASDALNRAGQMVELLGLKLLTLTNSLEANRRNSSAWSRSVTSANNEVTESLQTLTQAMQGGVMAAHAKAKADEEARTKAEQLAQFQKSWAAEQLRVAQTVETEKERIRQDELAALKKDIVDRHKQHSTWISDEARLLATEHSLTESARQEELAALRADIIARSAARDKENTDRRNQQSAWISDQARLLAQERAQAESHRQQELAALRADIIARNNLREQELSARQRTAAARDSNVFEDARRFSAGATIVGPQIAADDAAAAAAAKAEQERVLQERRRRAELRQKQEQADAIRFASGTDRFSAMGPDPTRQNQARVIGTGTTPGFPRMDPNNISPSFARVARDAVNWKKGQDSLAAMEKSITRMRHELDPMLAMQTRLANEADEFSDNLARAVKNGAISKAQADAMLSKYKQLAATQLQVVQDQQRSFAGMRNFGFAAQQAAYAVEDFGQVWGTMGFAGGMRAATNNLTAMLATLNPTLGVLTSVGAGLGLVALSIWESEKGAQALKDAEDKRLELRDKILNTYEREAEFQRELVKLRTADIGSLGSSSSTLREQADSAAAEARMVQRDELEKRIQKQTEIREAAIAAAKAAATAIDYGGSGAAPDPQAIRDMIAAQEESLRVSKETEIQQKFLRHLLQQQVDEYERMNSAAYKAQQREEQRQAIIQRALDLQKETVVQTDDHLSLLRGIDNLSRARFVNEENEVSRVQAIVQLTERLLSLRERGKAAASNVQNSLQDRFGGINPELAAIQDEIRFKQQIHEQTKLALAAGAIDLEQKANIYREMERILAAENERKQALEEIAVLEERAGKLKTMLGHTQPAGLTSAVSRGSEEAIRILEQDRLRQLSNKESEPIVAELRNVLQAIKEQRDILKSIADGTMIDSDIGAVLNF